MATEDKKIDEISGVETTGHSWDGIQELDNPLPRWWLITFWICIFVAIVYALLFPSIPYGKGYFKGLLGVSERRNIERVLAKVDQQRAQGLSALKGQDLKVLYSDMRTNTKFYNYIMAGGQALFKENCGACHGPDGTGQRGSYPNLRDDDWIWGGSLQQIHTTIEHGVRTPILAATYMARQHVDKQQGQKAVEASEVRIDSVMTPFPTDLISDEEASKLIDYVLSLSKTAVLPKPTAKMLAQGKELFDNNCAACHKEGGVGDIALGYPALNDKIWTFIKPDNLKRNILVQMRNPHKGVMPVWGERLTPEQIKMLTLFVYERSEGQGE